MWIRLDKAQLEPQEVSWLETLRHVRPDIFQVSFQDEDEDDEDEDQDKGGDSDEDHDNGEYSDMDMDSD